MGRSFLDSQVTFLLYYSFVFYSLFVGATADAFTLMERLEAKLDEYPGAFDFCPLKLTVFFFLQASFCGRRWSWPRRGELINTCETLMYTHSYAHISFFICV